MSTPKFQGDFDYVAKFPDMPGYGAACIDDDDPKWRKEIARTIADWIRRGATVERVTRHEACEGLLKFHEEAIKREKAHHDTRP